MISPSTTKIFGVYLKADEPKPGEMDHEYLQAVQLTTYKVLHATTEGEVISLFIEACWDYPAFCRFLHRMAAEILTSDGQKLLWEAFIRQDEFDH